MPDAPRLPAETAVAFPPFDLLYDPVVVCGDCKKTRDRLLFSFSSGDSAGGLRTDLQERTLPASDFSGDGIARDLFVAEFIETCMLLDSSLCDGWQSTALLKRILLNPPRDVQTIHFRQQIHAELSSKPALRAEFEALYRRLIAFRNTLDTADALGPRYAVRRRIDILVETAALFKLLSGSFADATSGLRRIPDRAAAVRRSAGFSILNEFLHYENHLATVALSIQVAPDGTVRKFRVLAATENNRNRFYDNPFRRFIDRVGVWLRGYGIRDGELVSRWIDTVFDCVVDELVPLLWLIGDMEFHLSALTFARHCESAHLATCLPGIHPPRSDAPRVATQLFNPLLLRQERPPVPCDIHLDGGSLIAIVTGPNSGGKTRLLQAVGLLHLLGQNGMPVPARSAGIHIASGMFVSLNAEPCADGSEGRLGMELLRVRRLFEQAGPDALVLLDELCAGTNPSEGEEIFRMVISLLRQLKPQAWISTHFLGLSKSLKAEGLAEVAFLQVELSDRRYPTYQFVEGVAETSLAALTASRLGVTREELTRLIDRNPWQ